MERSPGLVAGREDDRVFSDESGEYALHLAPQTGIGDVTKIPMPRAGLLPCAELVARLEEDRVRRLAHAHLVRGRRSSASRSRWTRSATGAFGDDWVPVWSPDSQVARLREAAAELSRRDPRVFAGLRQSDADHRRHERREDPVFDKDGKYLYFTASTDSGPSLQPDVGSFARPVTRSIYLAVLPRTSRRRSLPRATRRRATSHRNHADEPKPEAGPPAPDGRGEDRLRKHRSADPGDAAAAAALRRPAGRKARRTVRPGDAAAGPGQPPAATVHRHDLKTRKTDVAVSGVRFFEVSQSGEKMLTRQGDNWFIRNLPPPPPAGAAAPAGGRPTPGSGGS